MEILWGCRHELASSVFSLAVGIAELVALYAVRI